ncbi:hypothetical protein SLU01_29960 [Sporosarcina luteola]|uniref:Uncharacterized protein n=1 Tax=Sporosarcina luteola TaxID=582850 RepID=A0A511ZB72_9BACL|nr:hypothetical protein SLU01_29960 [Sporosarcina luteola]
MKGENRKEKPFMPKMDRRVVYASRLVSSVPVFHKIKADIIELLLFLAGAVPVDTALRHNYSK